MAICPHCQARAERPLDPCPTGDGYFCVEEDDFAANRGDDLLGVAVGGRFVVVSVLGSGSMAHVYKAHQLEVDRTVALKVFRSEQLVTADGASSQRAAASEHSRQRFIQEAKVLGKLAHPNCVTIYDFGQSSDGRYLYIAMEHIGGASLRTAINRGLKLEAILEIARQILAALAEAHVIGVVHRDLKPENVILSFRQSNDEPVVKVVDFGIAKLLGRERIDATVAGALFGTPAYMSPEQCRGDVDSVGPHSDIYALGCILFEMVSARLPFDSANPLMMIQMHQDDPVPEPQARSGLELTDEFAAFITRCMQKAPEDRFANAPTAMTALETVIAQAGGASLAHVSRLNRRAAGAKVVVPKNQIAGHEIDVPRRLPEVEVQPLPSPGSKDKTIGVQQISGAGESSAPANPRGSQAGTGVVLIAFFFLIIACVLLFYFMWELV